MSGCVCLSARCENYNVRTLPDVLSDDTYSRTSLNSMVSAVSVLFIYTDPWDRAVRSDTVYETTYCFTFDVVVCVQRKFRQRPDIIIMAIFV